MATTDILNDIRFLPVTHRGSTGDAHGVATETAAGFMSAEDKIKLDNMNSGVSLGLVIALS